MKRTCHCGFMESFHWALSGSRRFRDRFQDVLTGHRNRSGNHGKGYTPYSLPHLTEHGRKTGIN
jgi:hypothetical protein